MLNIKLNPDDSVVESVRRGLQETGGYCPCRTERSEETKCICTEFRNQAGDPSFKGFCRCMLYCTAD